MRAWRISVAGTLAAAMLIANLAYLDPAALPRWLGMHSPSTAAPSAAV